MSTNAFATDPAPGAHPAFAIVRWSASSGSSRPSRASLVISGAGRSWRAHATGNGAVDALLRAVDVALAPVLGKGLELQTYNVHATGQGHDTQAAVTLTLRPRDGDTHAPAYPGRGLHDNILEASVTAYVDAINRMIAHAEIDVAAAAPAPGATERPNSEHHSETRRRHRDTLMQIYNE
jgi:hypothetical protein